LFTKGARSVICRPTLHAGEAKSVKSPASIAAVGTNASLSGGSERIVPFWYAPKKNSLFFAMGPPMVPPYWFRFSVSRFVAKAFRALNIPLRTNSKTFP
jgi:hypothetical protein